MSFPVMIALSFEVDTADDVPALLMAIDPPRLRGFAGDARVVADVVAFMDGPEPLPDPGHVSDRARRPVPPQRQSGT